MIYRKRGVVTRWENGTLIHVTESGLAIEDGDLFECHPSWGRPPAGRPAGSLPAVSVPRGITIERLILTHGIAEHEYGDKQWTEETRRIHLALTREKVRVLIDQANFDLDDITRIADAMTRLKSGGQPRHSKIRLAPNVAAAVTPALPNAIQTAGGIDGKGLPIEEGGRGWYRPSYRVRPVRMPLSVRIECESSEIDEDLPRAVAVLADGRFLIDDGERSYPASVPITRIAAAAKERIWYPYAGGSFGGEMML